MGILDGILGRGTVSTGDSSSQSGGGTSNSGNVPGSANNNAIQSIGSGQIDTAFLDALYAGGKLTPLQRDAILAGSDPAGYGLSQYDLYCLTVGRLGARTTTALGLVTQWSASAAYAPGQVVVSTLPGTTQLGLFQAQTSVPVGMVPPNPTYWLQLSGAQAAGGVSLFSATTTYQPGQLVFFQPAAGQSYGQYLCQVAAPAGILPTDTRYWLQMTSPGPVVLYDADVLNPALTLISAVSGSVGIQTTPGAALQGIPIPSNRRYRVTVGAPRPVTAGTSTPTDSIVFVTPQQGESTGQDLSGNAIATTIIVPRWSQQGLATNTAVAAVAPGTLAARLRVELI